LVERVVDGTKEVFEETLTEREGWNEKKPLAV